MQAYAGKEGVADGLFARTLRARMAGVDGWMDAWRDGERGAVIDDRRLSMSVVGGV